MLVHKIRFKKDDVTKYSEWEEVKLEDVVDFLDGLRKPIETSKRVAGPYPLEIFVLKKTCLAEQQKIANFLSDFDSAIDLAKQEFEKMEAVEEGSDTADVRVSMLSARCSMNKFYFLF